MRRLIDLTGRKFGRLTVVDIAHKKNGIVYWNCQCDCGNKKNVSGIDLKNGHTKSCGCYNRECLSNRKIHGLSKKRIHNIWCGMKARCYNQNVKSYPQYGGRGITVCEQWRNDSVAFIEWSLANGYTNSRSIDRIDSNGNYEPRNCRWVLWDIQCRNTRQNHFVSINGITKCLSDWAREYGVTVQTAIKRMKRGWTIEESIGLTARQKETI
jgi:hypothetical protein